MNTSENAILSWAQLSAKKFVCCIINIDAMQFSRYFFCTRSIYNYRVRLIKEQIYGWFGRGRHHFGMPHSGR
jgi:hypothetical protein